LLLFPQNRQPHSPQAFSHTRFQWVLADPMPLPSPRLLSSCQHTDDTKFPNHTSVGLEKLDTATNEMSHISLTYGRPKKVKIAHTRLPSVAVQS